MGELEGSHSSDGMISRGNLAGYVRNIGERESLWDEGRDRGCLIGSIVEYFGSGPASEIEDLLDQNDHSEGENRIEELNQPVMADGGKNAGLSYYWPSDQNKNREEYITDSFQG